MEPTQLRQLIRDTLASNDLPAFMGKADDNAEALLCMIAAHETNCGHYLRQIKGSALGIFARIYLWRISEAIPDAADVDGLAEYAKTYWNTEAGKATPKLYADAYKKYFAPSTLKAKSSNAKVKTPKNTRPKTSTKSG